MTVLLTGRFIFIALYQTIEALHNSQDISAPFGNLVGSYREEVFYTMTENVTVVLCKSAF